MTKYVYPTSIREAAAQLDVIYLGWYQKINLGDLCMAHPGQCVLGQIFGGYYLAIDKHYTAVPEGATDDKIFGSNASASAWKAEVTRRIEGALGIVKPVEPKLAPHKHAKFIKAWAEGRPVWFKFLGKTLKVEATHIWNDSNEYTLTPPAKTERVREGMRVVTPDGIMVLYRVSKEAYKFFQEGSFNRWSDQGYGTQEDIVEGGAMKCGTTILRILARGEVA